MNPKITITGSKVKIAGFSSDILGKVSGKTIDMTAFAGQYVRIWLETDKSYSLDKHKDHFWQVAEFPVPEIAYEQVEEENPETKEITMKMVPQPLNLKGVEIETWELPQ